MNPGKEAYNRFRFKNKTCFKKCGLWQGVGGFCPAKRENIEYCMSLDIDSSDSYRNIQNITDWLEVFAEDMNILMYKPSEAIIERAKHLLDTTKKDCYQIAELIIKENYDGKESN